MKIDFRFFAPLLVALAALSFTACKASQKATATRAYTKVHLMQGGCFGNCPVYELTILPNGEANYLGKRYAPQKGLHNGMLPKDSLSDFNALVQAVLAKAYDLPKEIDSGIADAAMSIITIHTATDSIRFKGTTEFAPEVAALRAKLFSIAQHTAWTRDPNAEPLPASQLLVTVQAADQIMLVTEQFYRQNLKAVRMEKEEPATFLMSFDPFTMSAKEMVRDLRKHHAVVNVEIVENQ